ncbi:hypothetical protein LTR36_000130 [Oleoguttula mirabilis]|uniref:Uncharacterized protein n=1 Tax=Oleoguttula mirabilis TaxID=1507867 RepID=A0AAV9JZL5_9PEZI|nr:hypothetical protein LTR36_000130 [Oleoguttula mirabilis]
MGPALRIPSDLWDDTRFPCIRLGIVRFPAFILPLAAAFLFVSVKMQRRPTHPLRDAPILRTMEHPPLNEINAPAAAPDLDRFAAVSLDIFHYFTTFHVLYHGNISWHSADSAGVLGLSSAVALVLDGIVFRRSGALPCVATALGWACFVLRRPSSSGLPFMCLVALLALPCAWHICGSTQRGPWASGTLLLAYACDGLLPPTARIRGHRISPTIEDWPLVLWLASALMADVAQRARSVAARPHQPDGQPSALLNAASWVFDGLPAMIVRLATLMAPLAAAVCVTGFAFSSLNWRFLVLGLPSRPPVLDATALLAGQLALVLAVILAQLRKHEEGGRRDKLDGMSLPRATRLFADSTGWAVAAWVALWGGLTAMAPNGL